MIGIAFHISEGSSIEFVKLMMLYILAQYLIRFPIDHIERFVVLDDEYKNRSSNTIERNSQLLELQIFQGLDLDKVVAELYSRVDPLYYHKNFQQSAKMKLKEIIIYNISSKQMLFHYSFCYVI